MTNPSDMLAFRPELPPGRWGHAKRAKILLYERLRTSFVALRYQHEIHVQRGRIRECGRLYADGSCAGDARHAISFDESFTSKSYVAGPVETWNALVSGGVKS